MTNEPRSVKKTNSYQLIVISDMDVFNYRGTFLWMVRMFDGSGTEVASAKAESKSVSEQPALLNPIGKRVTAVGNRLEFKLSADAPKDAKVRFRMTGAPSDATLDPATGLFSWTPKSPGLTRVVFEAVSGEIADAELVKIEVEETESEQ